MADWIFEGNPRHYDLEAAVASSREQWWGTPHFRDQMAVGDRVWLQVVGPKDPGIYYIATITSPTYEHDVEPSDPRHFRWRTDIRFDYRVQPPLLRSELEADAELGSFRPFRGFEGSNVPVPPGIAAALAARTASRLEKLRLPHRHHLPTTRVSRDPGSLRSGSTVSALEMSHVVLSSNRTPMAPVARRQPGAAAARRVLHRPGRRCPARPGCARSRAGLAGSVRAVHIEAAGPGFHRQLPVHGGAPVLRTDRRHPAAHPDPVAGRLADLRRRLPERPRPVPVHRRHRVSPHDR